LSPRLKLTAFFAILLAACRDGEDADGDGVLSLDDCDDENAGVYPGADEYCDGLDNDCDGETDEEARNAPSWFLDGDGDGFGDGDVALESCEQPSGYTANTQDCDDSQPEINAGAVEICDGIDNDCDGETDGADADDAFLWHLDTDGDGYGISSKGEWACEPPSGYVEEGRDCDDSDPAVNPDAEEACNGIDDDCNGQVDEGPAEGALDWYSDGDGDGYGNANRTRTACQQPKGYVANARDCDDSEAAINPDASEVCDAVDNDCDGLTDDDDDSLDLSTAGSYYADDDGDGHGDPDEPVQACNARGLTVTGEDCDDDNERVHPDHEEVWYDGLDNDCDDSIDLDMLTEADAKLWGEAESDFAASAVSGAGDVDGDGLDDLLIGAYGEDGNGAEAGAAYLVQGSPRAGGALSSANAKFSGGAEGDEAGRAVAAGGDVDGDGYGDLLIGAPGADGPGEDAGAAYLVLGPVSGELALADSIVFAGQAEGDELGCAVAGAGDVNADGYDDLLFGASREATGGSRAGAAYLVLGPVSGAQDLAAAQAKLTGEESDGIAGAALAGAGDVNADGYADLLVGASKVETAGDASGAAYLVLGPVSGESSLSASQSRFLAEAEGDRAGWSVAGAGDVDGDGYDDLLIGAVWQSSSADSAGAAYLVRGPVSGDFSLAEAQAKLLGDGAGHNAGSSVSSAGDVDADGYADLLVGAYGEDSAGTEAGAAYLVLGPLSGELQLSAADGRMLAEAAGDRAGCSLAGVGDVDGNGYDDILVGAEQNDAGPGDDAGTAYFISGW